MNIRTRMAAAAFAALLVAGEGAASGGSGLLSNTDNLAKIEVGKTTGREVEQLLGAPLKVSRDGRRNWDYWEYRLSGSKWQSGTLWIGISSDGLVREVFRERERPVVG